MDLSLFVRRDISGIRKDILPLSGFGILSHALADEIAARNQAREGYFYTTDMEFLEEAEPEQPPVLPQMSRQPETVRMDMTLLFKIVQENQEKGKALPAGTQKMLERVRTIFNASPQSRAKAAPRMMQRMPIPQMPPQISEGRNKTFVSFGREVDGRRTYPAAALRQMGAPQDRMQNPLRDAKAPLAVEKMRMPSREVPRASDHAMLFSDVLHRAQDSGLTFATRKGQGNVPASAQTRTAYTAQALRQAKTEQQAAQVQNIPVWQRTVQKEASQTPQAVSGASWQFDGTSEQSTEINEASKNSAQNPAAMAAKNTVEPFSPQAVSETVQAGEKAPALSGDRSFVQTPADKMPELLRQMASPRYPETELDFAQEEAPAEGAEMPVSAVQRPSAENTRAMQEASAKALAESVRSALKEAAPLVAAAMQAGQAANKQEQKAEPSQESHWTPQKEAANTARQNAEMPRGNSEPVRTTQTQNTPASDAEKNVQKSMLSGAQGVTAPKTQEAETRRSAEKVQSHQVAQFEKATANAAGSTGRQSLEQGQKQPAVSSEQDTAPQIQQTGQNIPPQAGHMVENQMESGTNAEHSVPTLKNASAQGAESRNTAPHTLVQTGKAPEQPIVEQTAMLKNAGHPGTPENIAVQTKTPPQSAETVQTAQHPSTEITQVVQETSAKTLEESQLLNAETAKAERPAERVHALSGDRSFVKTPEEKMPELFRQMASPRYPETELNFAQEEAPAERAEMPVSAAQHPRVESIRAMQEASAKALTENVRSALKEAAPLMAPATQTSVQTQQTNRNIPPQARHMVENQMESGTNAEHSVPTLKHTSAQGAESRNTALHTLVQTGKTPEQPIVEQTATPENAGHPGTPENIAVQTKIPPQSAETIQTAQHPSAESIRAVQEASAKTLEESQLLNVETAQAEQPAERIPALSGDRSFAETPEERMSELLRQMALPRYPETELNFAQEEVPTEEKEIPVPAAQKPSADSIRAAQEASAKVLTESVRSALKEAALLMTPAMQTDVQTQQTNRNIPPRASHIVENQMESGTNAEHSVPTLKNAPAQNVESRNTALHTLVQTGKAPEQPSIKQTATLENAGRSEMPESVAVQTKTPPQSAETIQTAQHPSTESTRAVQETSAKALAETQLLNVETAQAEQPAERIPALSGDRSFVEIPEEKMPELLRQMASPRYPETELNFAQEEAPAEGAEMPVSAAQHPSVESIRAVQEASEKALAESVRSTLKEAAPLMTPATQTSVQTRQTNRNIPPRSSHIVENQMESGTNAEHSVPTLKSAPAQNVESENTAPHTLVQTGKAPEQPGIKQTATPEHTGHPGTSESVAVQTKTLPQSAETIQTAQHPSTETARAVQETSAKALAEAQLLNAETAKTERPAERIPALSGDRSFVGTPEEKMPELLRQMASPRYPETELNFAQEETPTEEKEIPVPAAQHPSAESIRAVQETSAKALTESVRSALKEAAPLMAPATQTSVQTQQTNRNIPPQASHMVENQMESGTNAEHSVPTLKHTSAQGAESRNTALHTLVQTGKAPGQFSMEQTAMPEHTGHSRTSESVAGQTKIPPQSAETIQTARHPSTEIAQAVQETSAKALAEAQLLNAETAQAEQPAERVPALSGDRSFVEIPEEKMPELFRQMASPRYPEAELDFAQEEAPAEGAEMPVSVAQHPSVESIRAVQEASAKVLTESVRSALKEAAPLMAPVMQAAVQKQAEQAVRNTVKTTLNETAIRSGTAVQSGLPQKVAQAVGRSLDTVLKQSTSRVQQTMQTPEEPLRAQGQTPWQEEAAQKYAEANGSGLPAAQKSRALRDGPEALYPEDTAEERLPPLSGGQTYSGQAGGMEQAMELLRQNGYGAAPLEYRMEGTGQEMPASELPRQTGTAAEKSLLWLGEKVAANAARELSRMQGKMPGQQNHPVFSGQMNRPGQPGGERTGNGSSAAQAAFAGRKSADRTAGQAAYQPIHTAARPMGIPAEAQWKPGSQAAPAQTIDPAAMPHLMYQTGQSEGTEVPFAPAGNSENAFPQPENSMEAQSIYPALSMEYSSPMSRMEQQLQSAMAQQMSAASRPMAMQTGAGQYMAGKAAPDSMKTLDQMSPPPVNDQIVWQNPYLRSAPADMTYRSKKKQAPEQPQPAPRPQAVRMSDAEIHRMADQVFRIVKDKIRQERRKMGL